MVLFELDSVDLLDIVEIYPGQRRDLPEAKTWWRNDNEYTEKKKSQTCCRKKDTTHSICEFQLPFEPLKEDKETWNGDYFFESKKEKSYSSINRNSEI